VIKKFRKNSQDITGEHSTEQHKTAQPEPEPESEPEPEPEPEPELEPELEPESDVAKIFVSLVRTISLLQDMLINVQYTFISLLNQ
jgi:hypothetical protein